MTSQPPIFHYSGVNQTEDTRKHDNIGFLPRAQRSLKPYILAHESVEGET